MTMGGGSCFSETSRTFLAALLIAFKEGGAHVPFPLERISFLEIHTPTRAGSKWSGVFLSRQRARASSAFAEAYGDKISVGHGLGFSILPGTAGMQPLLSDSRREFDRCASEHDLCSRDIRRSLGPWRLSALAKSAGRAASSTIVLIATQSDRSTRKSSMLLERGKKSENRCKSSRWDVEEQTNTLLAAAIAPCNNQEIKILQLFRASRHRPAPSGS